MRYKITEHGAEVEILVQDAVGHAPQVLAAFQQCQQGRCGCPTDQYDRLADMAIEEAEDRVAVRLRPREGQRFDIDQLEACMDTR
jgi:hypothetical protein